MELLALEELNSIHGGFGVGTIIGIFEIPFFIMDLRDLINYTVERFKNGCSELEDEDHFTHFFCGEFY